jgi:spore germination protein KB
MPEKGKISPRQAGELMFITILATIILFVPAITADAAGRDAWIATMAGSMFGFVTLAIIFRLSLKYPGRTIFQYCEDILGRCLGKAAALAYVWIFLHMAAIVVREYGDFLTTSFLPETPLSVFNFSLVFLAALAVLYGLEVIARANEFIILLVVVSLLTILTLSVVNWRLDTFRPVLAEGIMPVARGALIPAAWHGEIVTLAVIIPYLTRPRQAFWSGAAALTGSAILLTAGVIGVIAVFGPEFTAAMRFPIHLFVRTINIGQILTRFEPVVLVTWIAGVFIKTAVFYYAAVLGLAQVFNLSEYRPLVLSLGVVIATFSITLFEDVTELSFFLAEIWPLYGISVYFFGLPLLLLAVALARGFIAGRRGRKQGG